MRTSTVVDFAAWILFCVVAFILLGIVFLVEGNGRVDSIFIGCTLIVCGSAVIACIVHTMILDIRSERRKRNGK